MAVIPEEETGEVNTSGPRVEFDGDTLTCADLVYKLTVTNTTEDPVTFRIEINEKQNADKPINIHWPRTGLAGKLIGNESTVVGMLCKIEPSATQGAEAGLTEISKLNFSLKVKRIGGPRVEPSVPVPEENN